MNTTASAVQSPAAAVVLGVTEIAKAFLSRNTVPPADLPSFLRGISRELTGAAISVQVGEGQERASAPQSAAPVTSLPAPAEDEAPAPDPRWAGLSRTPVIPVSESVTDEAIICLFDGTPKKMLKRYIRARYGMEEHEYKAWFGLPADYPMVAPGYAAEKATVAIAQGLGSKIDKTPRHLRVVRDEVAA